MYANWVLQVAAELPSCAWHMLFCVHASQLAPCQPGLQAVHCGVVPFWHTPMPAQVPQLFASLPFVVPLLHGEGLCIKTHIIQPPPLKVHMQV